MQCKECQQPVKLSISGLGNFCSWECRKSWKSKKNQAAYEKRTGGKTGVGSHTQDSATISDCNQSKKMGGFEPSETTKKLIEELGGIRWYGMAKRLCCNFDIRAKEGYCSYLFNPKSTHRKSCNRCELGQQLMQYDQKRRK